MNRFALVLAVALCASQALAYTPPSDGELDVLLADPARLGAMLTGASAEEASAVVVRAIQKVDASELGEEQKKVVISLLVARTVAVMGSKGPATIALIAAGVDASRMQIVVAAATVAAGADASLILDAVVAQFGADSASAGLARQAAASPSDVLGSQLVALIPVVLPRIPGATATAGNLPLPTAIPAAYKGQ